MQTKGAIAIAMGNYGRSEVKAMVRAIWSYENNNSLMVQAHLFRCCDVEQEAIVMVM